LPNVHLLHFQNLKRDMPAEIRRLATFIETPIDEAKWESVLHHCSFDYMKEHGEKSAPLGGAFWDGGAKSFINKGTNGRWRDVLTSEESSKYERRALAELGSECAHWLATGEGRQSDL
ncbi:MAG: sulfotransferase domain-containing protein, partial [Halieaceae bacterium]|nr:sulfotransferase domain-containing protein [Halieaceae bacterium]